MAYSMALLNILSEYCFKSIKLEQRSGFFWIFFLHLASFVWVCQRRNRIAEDLYQHRPQVSIMKPLPKTFIPCSGSQTLLYLRHSGASHSLLNKGVVILLPHFFRLYAISQNFLKKQKAKCSHPSHKQTKTFPLSHLKEPLLYQSSNFSELFFTFSLDFSSNGPCITSKTFRICRLPLFGRVLK